MSLYSLLLRCVLLVSLVANAAGIAQASVRMDLAHAAHLLDKSPPVAGAARVASSDCHEQAESSGFDNDVAGPGQATAGAGGNGAGVPGCCDDQGCQCICAQHASATSCPGLEICALALSASGRVTGLAQHAAPLLPHLIRPPIG